MRLAPWTGGLTVRRPWIRDNAWVLPSFLRRYGHLSIQESLSFDFPSAPEHVFDGMRLRSHSFILDSQLRG